MNINGLPTFAKRRCRTASNVPRLNSAQSKNEGEAQMNITTIGIDLAKEIITAYAQDATGRCVMSRNFKFKELAECLVQLPPGCVVGMEACSTAHYWGRRMHEITGSGLTFYISKFESSM
jgi:hypothetical protein